MSGVPDRTTLRQQLETLLADEWQRPRFSARRATDRVLALLDGLGVPRALAVLNVVEEAERTDETMRMDAYYFGFDRTGNILIDRILSAVAVAGKWAHHTEQWNDDEDWKGEPMISQASRIQAAANAAADALRSVQGDEQ